MDNLRMIKPTIIAAALIAISGISEAKEESKTIHVSACDQQKINEQLPDDKKIQLLWSCNRKDQAIDLAERGAASGSAEGINIYLRILAANNDPTPGLAYAIKNAESGDTESARWVMRISETHNMTSLDRNIGQWILNSIIDPNTYIYPVIDEYIKYAITHSSKENYTPISYGLAFFSLSKSRLDEREAKRISTLMEQLEKISTNLGVNSNAHGEAADIVNFAKKTDQPSPTIE